MTFKPMLSATLEDPAKLKYPVLVSTKLDGLRCIIKNGKALSRNLKPFRNAYVQSILNHEKLEGLDGELIVGPPNQGHVLNRTQSGIMSEEGLPDFKFHIFDCTLFPDLPFKDRLESLDLIEHTFVQTVPHQMVGSSEELLQFETKTLEAGYEGIMIRGINAPYKHGRATNNEHSLFKYKRFRDGEAIVVGLEEGTINENAATIDNLGRSRRSAHQDNLTPAGRIGTILGQDLVTKLILNISPGRMTMGEREFFWDNPKQLVGRIVKYKTFDYGSLDAPRFTTFQAFRDVEDL